LHIRAVGMKDEGREMRGWHGLAYNYAWRKKEITIMQLAPLQG
jgi:hypothetical protein